MVSELKSASDLESSLAERRMRFLQSRALELLIVGSCVLCGEASHAQPRADREVPVALIQRFSVGGSSDDTFTPEHLFPKDIATDAKGNLYLLNRADGQILQLSAKGDSRRTFGRKGRGPGEIVRVSAIAVGASGELVASDLGKRAFVRFSPNGEPIAELSSSALGTVQEILSVRASEMVVLATGRGGTSVARLRGGEIVTIVSLPFPETRPVRAYERCGLVGQTAAPLLSPTLLAAADDAFVVTHSDSNFSIVIHENGMPPRTLDAAGASVRLSRTVALQVLGDSQVVYVAGKPCSVSTSQLIDEAGLARQVQPYSRLLMSFDQQVWAVRTGGTRVDRIVDIFSVSKGYIGWAKIGRANPVAFLADGGLVSLEFDDLDVPRVVVYDVRRRSR